MSAGERILQALELGATTIDKLAAELGLSYYTVYSAMTKLQRDGLVMVTKAGGRRRSGRIQNLYSLVLGGAVPLGQVTNVGLPGIVRLIGDILFEQGEVALFIGANRMAAIVVHDEPGYADALRDHGKSLVGVYRSEHATCFDTRRLAADINDRLAELGGRGSHAA